MPGEVFSLLVPHLRTEKDDSDTMRKKKVLSCVYHAMLGVELFLAPLQSLTPSVYTCPRLRTLRKRFDDFEICSSPNSV